MTTLPLRIYGFAARMAAPFIALFLARRARTGKEIPARISERYGIAGRTRPAGPLIWVHAASVGETISIMPVIIELAEYATILLTTGTVTSASIAAGKIAELDLADRVIHQFVPLDVPRWVARFLDHWAPDAAIFVESEIWPHLIAGLTARGVQIFLLNGRMSAKSFQLWQRAPRTAGFLMGLFRWIAAQSEEDAVRFRGLGSVAVLAQGNLKFAAPALTDNEPLRSKLAAGLSAHTWLAASTHPGEEIIAIDIHRRLLAHDPNATTIIVPRHPARAGEIASLAPDLTMRRRAHGETPEPGCIYLADTLGELGVFFRLCPIAFIGGSLVPIGGHNVLEAARLGCAVLIGPHTDNFSEPVTRLQQAGGLMRVADATDLETTIVRLWENPALVRALGEAAQQAADQSADLPAHLAGLVRQALP
ncbi:MAG TPA: 3-deoxy-D-manno-octulosonic acid transferase [Acetobacteraceae bacterium]|nr:3-deoxy-D-manno-octulosonic acid transferase [Acetobacteraceae bacterium]